MFALLCRRSASVSAFLAGALALPFSAFAAQPGLAPSLTGVPGGAEVSGVIELFHQLGDDKGAQLRKLVDRFNQVNRDFHIVLRDKPWSQGQLPHLMILNGADQARLVSGGQRFRPLYQVMKDAGEPLQAARPPSTMAPTPLDALKRLNALPVALSTPVLFYNRQAFRDAGLNPDQPPKTWFDLQQALGKLYDAGQACPYTTTQPAWVLVENAAAWHNEPVASQGGRGSLAINGFLEVKHVAMLSSWYKARYLQIFGHGDEGTEKFASGQCAVLTASSGDWPTLQRTAKFDVGVSTLPYHEDFRGAPQNTLADGPAMWVAAGKKPAEYKAVARFVSMWLKPETQMEWQRDAGYLPLDGAGVLNTEARVAGGDLAGIRVAVSQLTNKPATPSSQASAFASRPEVVNLINEELDDVWADRKPAKAALDQAVARSRNGNLSNR